MGSPFPDGTTLGASDTDHDDYARIAQALLRDPPSGRIGKKGAVFFVRVRGRSAIPSSGFAVKKASATGRSPSASSPRSSASSRRRSIPKPDRPTAGSGAPARD